MPLKISNVLRYATTMGNYEQTTYFTSSFIDGRALHTTTTISATETIY